MHWLCLVLCGFFPVLASAGFFQDEPVLPTGGEVASSAKPEARIPLPPWPSESDLTLLPVDEPSGRFRYLLDSRHLTIFPEEGTVRYTLVIESAQGVRNVSYEGLQCGTGHYRSYAFGDAAGQQFLPNPRTEWLAVTATGDRYRRVLWRTVLCDATLSLRPVSEIRALLSGRGRPDGRFQGFFNDSEPPYDPRYFVPFPISCTPGMAGFFGHGSGHF